MKKICAVALLVVFAGSVALAAQADTASGFCKTFVERNKTCQQAIHTKCSTTLRDNLLRQIAASPPEFQPAMKAELDSKLEMFCTEFVSQITGEKAVPMCESKANTMDPAELAELNKVKGCLGKATCSEYADCAVEFN